MRSIGKASLILFSLLWVLILLMYYGNRHQNHILALTEFKQFDFFLFIQLFGIALFLLIQFINSAKVKRIAYTGTCCLIALIVCMISVLSNFNNFIDETLSIGEIASFVSRFLSILFIIFSISTAMFGAGSFVAKRFGLKEPTISLQILLGCCALISILFILAALHTLNRISLLITLLTLIGISYKESGMFVRDVLITPLKERGNINYWGFICIYFILIAISINILAVLSPFPYGFDSRNFYMNVTQLIAENNGLVEGFQPYNWQLIMSSGFVLTNSHEVAILLSLLAFLFSIVAINEFMDRILKMNINYRLLVICLFTLTPAVYNQLSVDVKIDFGLLFFQIVILHLFIRGLQEGEFSFKHMVLIGILCGFAMGVKFTHLYLIASIVIVYAGLKGGYLGLVGAVMGAIAVFLIAKVDEIGGLRTSHLGVEYVQWLCLLFGIIFFVTLGVTSKEKFWKITRFTLMLGVFTAFPLAPWVAKNYSDTESLSPRTLLMGEAPGAKINAREMIRNYNKLNK